MQFHIQYLHSTPTGRADASESAQTSKVAQTGPGHLDLMSLSDLHKNTMRHYSRDMQQVPTWSSHILRGASFSGSLNFAKLIVFVPSYYFFSIRQGFCTL